MQRSKPIRRYSWMRRRRPEPRRSERARDVDFMLRVKTLPCLARDLSECSGPTEADHAGRRPMGRKCSDRETVPLCSLHHRQRTDFSGPFKSWNGLQMRAWLDEAILTTQLRLSLKTEVVR